MIQLLKKWLFGTADAADERELDRWSQEDDFMADALAGYRSMPEKDHQKAIADLKSKLPGQTRDSRRNLLPWRLAAAAALIGVVGTWIFLGQQKESTGLAMSKEQTEEIRETVPTPTLEANEPAPFVAQPADAEEASSAAPAKILEQSRSAPPPQADLTSELKKLRSAASEKNEKEEVPRGYTASKEVSSDAYDVEAAADEQVQAIENKPIAASTEGEALTEQAAPPNVKDQKVAAQNSSSVDRSLAAEPKKDTTRKKRKYSNPPTSSRQEDYSFKQITIRGVVLEAGTEEPLIGANILLMDANTGTITDFDGAFTLRSDQPLPWTLELTYTGFATQTVKVTEDNSRLEIRMEDAGALLDEVVVSGYNSRPKVLDIDPNPKGGWKKFDRYVDKNLQYPEEAVRERLEGTVQVDFYIDSEGKPINFDIRQSLCEPCDAEAIRLLKAGPKWRGKDKRASVIITFKL